MYTYTYTVRRTVCVSHKYNRHTYNQYKLIIKIYYKTVSIKTNKTLSEMNISKDNNLRLYNSETYYDNTLHRYLSY